MQIFSQHEYACIIEQKIAPYVPGALMCPDSFVDFGTL